MKYIVTKFFMQIHINTLTISTYLTNGEFWTSASVITFSTRLVSLLPPSIAGNPVWPF